MLKKQKTQGGYYELHRVHKDVPILPLSSKFKKTNVCCELELLDEELHIQLFEHPDRDGNK